MEKEVTKIDKKENKLQKTYLTYYNFSARFMASLLSNLVNNLSEEILGIKYKYRYDVKKW